MAYSCLMVQDILIYSLTFDLANPITSRLWHRYTHIYYACFRLWHV